MKEDINEKTAVGENQPASDEAVQLRAAGDTESAPPSAGKDSLPAERAHRRPGRRIRRLVYAALFLALALVLPFLTGQIPEIGSMLAPMHIPVLLCGFVCGWPWGLAVGLIAPLLRSLLFSMPPMFPTAVSMALELAAYGAVSGLLYRLLPKKAGFLWVSLIGAMVAGRAVWGAARYVLAGLAHSEFPFSAFIAGAVTTALPGIAAQLVLVPLLVLALRRAGPLPGDN